MKLLVLACALLAAEAAKLQGYNVPHPGPAGVPFPTPSGLQPSVLTASAGSHQHGLLTSGGQVHGHSGGQVHGHSGGQVHGHSGHSFAGPGQQIALGSSGHFHPAGSGHLSVSEQVSVNNIPGGVSPSGLSGGFLSQTGIDALHESCPEGQVRHVDGTCVTPEVTRNVFAYTAPAQEPRPVLPPVNIPVPKEEHNIVFIRTPEGLDGPDPIIIPPPQRKNIIYVLNKESEHEGPKVIEVPAPASKNPEVYFVNYADGETPTLPDGIDFESALNSAIHAEGQVIGGSAGVAPFDGSASGLGIGAVGPSSSGFGLVADDSGEVLLGSQGGAGTFGGAPSFGGAASFGGAVSLGGAASFGGAPSLGGAASFGGAPSLAGAASFGVSSGAPHNFVKNDRFADGFSSGVAGPSAGAFQTQTNIVASVPQGFGNVAAGPSSAAFQAPASNFGAAPQRLYSAP